MVGRPCVGVKSGKQGIQRGVAEQVAYTSAMPDSQTAPYPPLSGRYSDFFDLPVEAAAPRSEVVAWAQGRLRMDRHGPTDAGLTVLLVHGAGGYGRMFAPLAAELAAAGYEVLAPDLPGYGLSPAPWQQVDYAAWKRALLSLIDAEHRRRPRPFVLLGASIGGYLAYLVATESPWVQGLAATTLADPRDPVVQAALVRQRWMRRLLPGLRPLSKVSRGLRVPVRWFTHMQRMSRNPGLTALVCADPLGGGNRVPLGLLASLFHTAPALEPEQFNRCPVLMLHPACDDWTPVAISDRFYQRLAAPKQRVLLDGCGHFPVEQPGLDQLRAALLPFLARAHAG
ncbi:TPA: alpha/beta hydrolase [Stenotrophomonas maltophilia]|uniref:Alpha/beta hydrolase n=2 Tax=Stenotrophomonas TaxID=40323 RepID=A0AAJ2TMR2_STEMA|nr:MULTISPECIES: alpha/beta hydrolase [Stenotrophomonas]MBH1482719.1 alpha/beta hydrolase [Stenotrophomonas maltophilia]MDQ7296325.1 alpha/beta hydrolase [Stenotrophomonas sp. Sm0041]MDZ5762924.1 alpha/beta hydrolase [Stenotrophomonas maltophilia]